MLRSVSSHESVVSYLQLSLPVRTLIVDDERKARERVRSLLERTDDVVEIVGECRNGVEALQAVQAEAPELLFLDVEMPELGGLAMVEAIESERCPQVVFVTAYERYLQRAFDLHALDYLRKPFTDKRFYDALRHACHRVLQERLGQSNETHDRVLTVLAELRGRSQAARDRLVFQDKESGSYRVIRSHDIDWIEAHDGGAVIHVGPKTYSSRQILADLETQLDPGVFMRIHRGRIVNCARITEVKRTWKGEYSVILASGKALGTGRTYQRALKAFLTCT